MQTVDILSTLPFYLVVIGVMTGLGSIIGEFYRNNEREKKYTASRFLSTVLASWALAAAAIFIIQSVFNITDIGAIAGWSIFFGFSGHKVSSKRIEKVYESFINNFSQ